ncbi:MAG: hypothetical protein KY461_05935 [Actinobacteria bacterium]|nr:hypothetical protein [Actinomycetota bacterium]
MGRDEVEAAYFTLLRAREELDGLRRYDDYLRDERGRLRRFGSEGDALADRVEARYRRTLGHTDEPIADAIRTRLAVIDEELTRLPDRLAAAEEFVEECEREHAELRRSA